MFGESSRTRKHNLRGKYLLQSNEASFGSTHFDLIIKGDALAFKLDTFLSRLLRAKLSSISV